MALDIYVGTLTRYHIGDLETVGACFAREDGIQHKTIRTQPAPNDAVTDPEIVRKAVQGWRSSLEAGLRQHLSTGLTWDERADAPYFTDRPWQSWHTTCQ